MRLHLLLLLVLTLPAAALTSQEKKLFEAAKNGDTRAVQTLVRNGVHLNRTDDNGNTALHVAIQSGQFATALVLLDHYAAPSLTNRVGLTPLDISRRTHGGDRPDLEILLRAHAYFREHQAQDYPDVTDPSRVLILENTVNYLHPKIAAHYAVNRAERDGRPGVDDDRNGFVDDAYGWDPAGEKPYLINPLQFEVYLKNRDVIGRLLKIETAAAAGLMSRFEAERQLAQYTNPLAQIMGPVSGLTDRDFIDMVKTAAHGSHVAGIILENSRSLATVSAVQIASIINPSLPFGDRTEPTVVQLIRSSSSLEDYLTKACAAYRNERDAIGQRYSAYIGATGAGVANLSFGTNLNYAEGMVVALTKYYLNAGGYFDGDEWDLQDIMGAYVLDFYLADAVTWAMVFVNNPNVLFVCAAGNENEDNDRTFGSPGYLARILSNVITVAATDNQDRITDFSDRGRQSVPIAALGQDVLSTVVPEADIYMDGTSMAAPAVAGAAALLRQLSPDLTAAEVRNRLLYSSRAVSQLSNYTVSAGVLDPQPAIDAVQGDKATRITALLRLARRALALPSDFIPSSVDDAEKFVRQALELDRRNVDARNLLKKIQKR